MITTIFADTPNRTIQTFQVEWKGKLVLMVSSGCCGPVCQPGEHELEEWSCGDLQDAVAQTGQPFEDVMFRLWCLKCDSYGVLE